MRAAESACNWSPPQGVYQWSPKLEKAGQLITYWRSRLSRIRIPVPPPPFETSIKKRLSIEDNNSTDIVTIKTYILCTEEPKELYNKIISPYAIKI